MKVPFKSIFNLEAFRPTPLHKKQNSMNVEQGRNRGDNSFYKVLTDNIEMFTTKGDFPSESLPLDRVKLQQLAEIIQMKMNSSLLQSLAESDEDNTPGESLLDLMSFREISSQLESLVSKIKQPFQKTNSFEEKNDMSQIIDHASNTHGVDPDLIKAVIRAESDFDANRTSNKGAMGLMQLMPETAKEVGVKNPYDPVENIMGGTRYLKSLLNRYEGNIPLALAAYNWGMGNVEKYPDRLPQETRTYIARISQYYREATS